MAAPGSRRTTAGLCVKLVLALLVGGGSLGAWAAGPLLPLLPDVTVPELTALTVTNTASSSDVPAPGFTYTLLNAPPGATIDADGVIRWTPSEAQGPSTNLITTVVTDTGTPPLSATNQFTVVVQELNTAPVLPAVKNVLLVGPQPLLVTNAATDADLPANALCYLLPTAPAGSTIDPNGVITWTPTVAQIPSTNVFLTVVVDSNPCAVNTQHLSATNAFVVVVARPHCCGPLPGPTDVTLAELTPLRVTNSIVSADEPGLSSLTYTLLDPPAGVSIDTHGVITWTPTEAQGPSTNLITTVVTDGGSPPLFGTNRFTVVVQEINSAPVLPLQLDRVLTGLQTLCVTNTAADVDLPANALAYQLLHPPAGATIDTNGVIRWTPDPSQLPSTNAFVTVVTDASLAAVDARNLSATNFFTVTVQPFPKKPAPVLQNAGFALGQFSLTWTAIPGRTYRLQYKELAPAAPWVDVLPEVTASGCTASVTHNVGAAPARLYRVMVVP